MSRSKVMSRVTAVGLMGATSLALVCPALATPTPAAAAMQIAVSGFVQTRPITVLRLPRQFDPLTRQDPLLAVRRSRPPDPEDEVGAANDAARIQPDDAGFDNAIQRYAYSEGALFQIYAKPGQVTDIALQEGEKLVGPGPVAAGDTMRWMIGDTLSGSGALELATGGADQYAELPSGIVSSLTSVSIEAWFVYETTGSWQRVFDFGSTAEGVAGTPGTGQTYLFFTPKVGNQSGPPRTTFTDNGVDSEVYCAGSGGLARNQTQHVVVSVDTVQHTLSLYLNGTLQSAKAFPGALNTLDDTNNWLGRSQFEVDPLLAGSIEEFRIYSVALTALQASFSYDAGPNPPFLD